MMQAMRRNFLVAFAIIFACLLAYGSVLSADFINFDDDVYVYQNPHVRQGLASESIYWALTTPNASIYQPLTMLSLMLDAQIHGIAPFGFHLTNLLLHIINSLLLLFVLTRFSGSFWPAALAAAVFSLHPLKVESVAWVTERKDLLSGLFFFLTLAAYYGWQSKQGWWRYFLVFLSLALGLLAKQILVTLPMVLLLLDWWLLFPDPAGQGRPISQAIGVKSVRRLIYEKAPFFLLALFMGLVSLHFVVQSGAAASLDRIPMQLRLANAATAYMQYLGKFFWPTDLAIFYPFPAEGIPYWQSWGSLAILVGISMGVVFQAKKRSYLAIGWFWFLGMLAPMSGIFQSGSHALADRFTYLPAIGLAIMLGWGGRDLLGLIGNVKTRKLLAVACAGIIVLALAELSRRQSTHWQNSESVYRHAIAAGNHHHFLYTNLGSSYVTQGRLDEARENLQQALALKPNDAKALLNLGLVENHSGQKEASRKLFRAAIAADPSYADAYDNLAIALFLHGEYQDAWANVITCIERGGRPHPGFLRDLAKKVAPDLRTQILLEKHYPSTKLFGSREKHDR